MVQVLISLIALLLASLPATAQTCTGRFPPNTLCGNSGASPAEPSPIPFGSVGTASNAVVYDTPSAFVAPPNGISYVTIASMNGVTSGTTKDACPLTYRKGTTTATNVPGEVNKGGTFWQPVYATSPVRTCQFGTIGDGVADDTSVIQLSIDYALRYHFNTVCINDGAYVTSDTIHLGYGYDIPSQTAINFTSCNYRRMMSDNLLAGVIFKPTKTDRCVFNFQGALNSSIRGISIIGANKGYIGSTSLTPPYPTTAAGWFDPTLVPTGSNPGGLTRYSPYGAICVNSYSGSGTAGGQTTQYPPVSYPSWTCNSPPCTAQYNKNYSSGISVEEIRCEGFAVCTNVNPGSFDSDNGGDLIYIKGFVCKYSTYCFSINHDLSRSNRITDVAAFGNFTVISNNAFGIQQGNLTPWCDNINVKNSYQIFQIGAMQVQGWIHCKDITSDQLVRIGSFGGGATPAGDVHLENCNLNFNDHSTGVSPAALIEFAQRSNLVLRQCTLNSWGRIQTVLHTPAGVRSYMEIDGGTWSGAQDIASLFPTMAMQQAVNFTGSLFVGNTYVGMVQAQAPNEYLTWLTPTTTSALSSGGTSLGFQQMGNYLSFTASSIQYLQSTTGLIDYEGNKVNFAARPMIANAQDLSAVGGMVVTGPGVFSSCDVLTFNMDPGFVNPANQIYNAGVGDLMYNSDTGTSWVITSVTGTSPVTFTARQMNNMKLNTSTGACTGNNFIGGATSGNFPTGNPNTYFVHTNTMVPGRLFFGDFIKGSTTISNIKNPATGGNPTGSFNVGDSFWANAVTELAGDVQPDFNWPISPGTKINTVGSTTITLTQPSLLTGTWPILPLPAIGYGRIKTILGIESGTGVAYSTLPTCNGSFTVGLQAVVSDSTTIVPGTIVAGGGSNWVQAVCSGVNQWLVQIAWSDNGSAFSAVPGCFGGNYLGLRATINDSTVAALGAVVAGGGTNKVTAVCNSNNNWVVAQSMSDPAPVGTTGTCTTGVTVVGSSSAGTWTSTAACNIASTIILSSLLAAPNGYACNGNDMTTTGVVLQQTASTTTSATLTVRSVNAAASDIISYKCTGY